MVCRKLGTEDAEQIDTVALSEPLALQPAVREYQVVRASLLL